MAKGLVRILSLCLNRRMDDRSSMQKCLTRIIHISHVYNTVGLESSHLIVPSCP